MDRKVVLITGASRGIGRATALYLTEKGFTVFGSSRSADKDLGFDLVELDVTDDTSVQTCIDHIIEKEGRIDVLINNAGFGMVGPLEDCSVEDVKRQFDTNFFGVHRMVTAVLPHMKEQKSGLIINIGSFGGRLAIPYQALYSASKAALAMYSDGLRMELARKDINVTLIEPGDTSTEFDTGRIEASNYDPQDNEIAERALSIMREAEQNGTSPKKIAKTIYKIIKKGRPKPRYTTGIDATIIGVIQRFIPYSIQEKLIMMNYKVPKK